MSMHNLTFSPFTLARFMGIINFMAIVSLDFTETFEIERNHKCSECE